MILHDFSCASCGWVAEKLVKSDTYSVECDVCSGEAIRLPAAVGLLRTNFHDSPKVKVR